MIQTSDQPKPNCNNPKGKNQYSQYHHIPSLIRPASYWQCLTSIPQPQTAPIDDPRIPEILRAYHRRGISDRRRLRDLIRDDHGIIMRSVLMYLYPNDHLNVFSILANQPSPVDDANSDYVPVD